MGRARSGALRRKLAGDGAAALGGVVAGPDRPAGGRAGVHVGWPATGIVGADAASIFCVLWILKLGLHAPALGTLARVISNERATIASVLILFFIVLVIAATGAHLLERERQPDAFGSLPNALWWAVVTLTTTGYGDVVPLTVGGRWSAPW